MAEVHFVFTHSVIIRIYRSPVDSVVTKGDLVGLYDQCVTVILGDGRMVEQNIYPGETHCQPVFKRAWQALLNSRWNQVLDKLE